MRRLIPLMALALLLAGCFDSTTSPRHFPPAAPRGFQSTTGDHSVRLDWLANTEPDIAGYRVYMADCRFDTCPPSLIGATSATTFTVDGLQNGVTKHFAVSAVDQDGFESDLSYDYEDVFDTPRPAGTFTLASMEADTSHCGWDFSAFGVVSYGGNPSSSADIVFSVEPTGYEMLAPFTDTDIQDAGYATTLDAVDFAPDAGWSPTGRVELIPAHCYVVWTNDDHYAKFRVLSVSSSGVTADWAYQIAQGNRELRARRAPSESGRVLRAGMQLAAR